MEFVLVGLVFSALNFGAMEGFTNGYDALHPKEKAGEVEIQEVNAAEQDATVEESSSVVMYIKNNEAI